jgi:hypothetical protein
MKLGLSFSFAKSVKLFLAPKVIWLDLKNSILSLGPFFRPKLKLGFLVFYVCKKIQATLNAKNSLVGIVVPKFKHRFKIGN